MNPQPRKRGNHAPSGASRAIGDILVYRRPQSNPDKPPERVIGRIVEFDGGLATLAVFTGTIWTTYRVWPSSNQLRAATKRERERWLASVAQQPVEPTQDTPEETEAPAIPTAPIAADVLDEPTRTGVEQVELAEPPAVETGDPEDDQRCSAAMSPEPAAGAASEHEPLTDVPVETDVLNAAMPYDEGLPTAPQIVNDAESAGVDLRTQLRRLAATIEPETSDSPQTETTEAACEATGQKPVDAAVESNTPVVPATPETEEAAEELDTAAEPTAGEPDETQAEIATDVPDEPALAPQLVRADIPFIITKEGKHIPEITRGTQPQLNFAHNLLQRYASQTPAWVTELVRDETTLCNATAITDSVNWISWLKIDKLDKKRDEPPRPLRPIRRLYGTLHAIVELCLSSYTYGRTQHMPTRLLAILHYVGKGGELAKSPRLDQMVKDHPLLADDATHVKMETYPLQFWGRLAEDGLRRIDPEARAPRWIAMAEPVDVPSLIRCTEIPCSSETDLYAALRPFIVLTWDGAWWQVSKSVWCPTDKKYHFTVAEHDGRKTRRKVAPEDVRCCFYPTEAGEQAETLA